MPAPPRTKRFCLTCMKVKSFKYDRVLMHSRCVECACGAACRPEVAKAIIKHVKEDTNKVTTCYNIQTLNNKLCTQKKAIRQLLEQVATLKEKLKQNE